MRHAINVAVTAARPAWSPKTETLRETLTRQYDAWSVRYRWRIARRWLRWPLAALGIYLF